VTKILHVHTKLVFAGPDPLASVLWTDKAIPETVALRLADGEQRAIPAIAKDLALTEAIRQRVQSLPTTHSVILGDSREASEIPDGSVHLVVTSPPYWTLKKYAGGIGQLGDIESYEGFLTELDRVWSQAYRALIPGGRLVVVVGDVCVSRKRYGRHLVFPLHASIQERCRSLGFDNLAPIIWHKISNASLEATGNGTSFLGKPYEPGGIIKNDIEYILMQRKPGDYRKPSLTARALSIIPEAFHRTWFQQIWDIKGASTRRHPAPYPLELAERLVRMFSFVGATVMDPFLGTGTTSAAAALRGRNSIGFEVEATYHAMALDRLRPAQEAQTRLMEPEEEGR